VQSTKPWQHARDIGNGIALICLLFAVSLILPIAGFIGAMLIPLPVMFYRTKSGRRPALIVAGVTLTIMMAVMGGFSLDGIFFVQLLLIGLTLGECIQYQARIEQAVGLTCIVVLAALGGTALAAGVIQGGGPVGLVTEYITRNLELSIALYKDMGMPAETVATIEASIERITYVFVRVVPAIVTTTIIFVSWANLVIAGALFRRRQLPYPDYGRLNRWSAPDLTIWLPIVSGLLLLIPSGGVKLIGINGLLIACVIYFLQGIAIVSYFFEKKNVPRFVRVFFYTLIVIQQVLALIVIGVRLFDMWIDIRKIRKKQGVVTP
jgi:uncharacterized protein YybS (DUF2232 family)